MILASIEKVLESKKHENADSLSVAKVLGWQVVTRLDEFKPGDLAVFVPIDTLLPVTPWSQFLASKSAPNDPIRVKNARLRGEFSQGILFPTSVLPEGTEIVEGKDVAEILGITKYEKPLQAGLAGKVRGNYPRELLNISDEDNLLSNPHLVEEFKGETCYITQKFDGSSGTFIYNNGEFMICSRRLILEGLDHAFGHVAVKYDIENKLKNLGYNIALQFECVGPSIQKNPLGLKEVDGFVFFGKNLTVGKELGLQELYLVTQELKIPMVPVLIDKFLWDHNITTKDLQDMANKEIYKNGKPCEGIVVRPINPKYSQRLQKNLSAKIINQNYKD